MSLVDFLSVALTYQERNTFFPIQAEENYSRTDTIRPAQIPHIFT